MIDKKNENKGSIDFRGEKENQASRKGKIKFAILEAK